MAKPSTSWPSSRVGVLACLLAVLVGVAGVVAQAPTWQQRSVSAPSSRNNSAAAYDVYRGVTTVFGGYNGSNTALGDTWEWNGTLWAPRITPVRPSARWGHGMAFDQKRGRAVLFGGFDGAALRSDTWEWDGANWVQRAVPFAPPARAYLAMAYDGARGVCVLFGGQDASGAALGDTWEYDGVTWLQRSAATAPSARRNASCAWDEVRRETLLFGGGDGATVSSDLWAWNGTTWSQKAATGGPSARWAASLAFDGNCGRAVLHGGADQAFANNLGDSWAWDGVQWTQLAGAQPAARHGAVQVHDAQRGQFVLWGGRDAAGFRSDTWELGPSCSRTMAVVTPPVVGQTAQFRYDYPPAAAFHFGFPLVTVRQPLAFAVPIPGFPSIGLCRVDLFTADLAPVLLDGSGSLTTALAIPNNPALWGFEFDVQAVDLDFFTLTLRWAENDLEVTTGPAPPVASFVATPTSGSAPLTVSFTNNSTYATSYAWTFGDGTSSTAANPPAKVYLGGTYTVSLTATGPGGTSTTQQQIVVSGGNAAPVASFTATPTSGSAPLTVQFTDTSTQSPLWWLWDFDNDGVFDSTQQNPSWTYTSNGVYSVRLVAVNYLGGSTVTRSALVFVGVPPINPALNMVPITPGTFQMGSTAGNPDEQPVRQVTLSTPFWMGKYEVTQAQYQAVVGGNPSYFAGAPNAPQRPVEQVSWFNAVAYCQALTASEQAAGRVPPGYQYRLPTEAEWEYCCRAGTTTEWHTGTSLTTSQANFQAALNQTAVVGSYAPNAFGLHDMHGNVWEWCLDSYATYAPGPVIDPFVAVTGGAFRVVRGGSWVSGNSASNCRSPGRGANGDSPGNVFFNGGFRVVLAPVIVP
jgi:formylglycine-generating enzyme required for sulfatase activity